VRRYLIYPMLFLMFVAARLFAAEAVWIEGEDASEHNFRRHGWYDRVDKSLLSNREWLSHYSQEAEGRATSARPWRPCWGPRHRAYRRPRSLV
jgi:hypothetical protein